MIVAPSAAVPARDRGSSLVVAVGSRGLRDAVKMPAGNRSSARVSMVFEGDRRLRGPAGIDRAGAVDAAAQRVLAQHHLGMLGEIAVHRMADDAPSNRRAVACVVRVRSSHAQPGRGRSSPRHAGACPASRRWNTSTSITTSVPALARMLPSGRRTAPTRSAMRGDVLARRGAGLVHRAGAGDEQRDAAGRSRAIERAMK